MTDPSNPSGKAPVKVLLVDDYAANILVARTLLEQFGYDCEVALNGREALEKMKATRYGVVLMDVQMAELNGLEATKAWREYEQGNNLPRLPIIGMTAHAMASDKERCLAAGMDDYLPKPFDFDDFKDKLEFYISGKKKA